MNRRLWGFGFLITLPTLALCAFGVWFYFAEAPKFIRKERRAATILAEERMVSAELAEERRKVRRAMTDVYRQSAEALWLGRTEPTFEGPRQKGWRQVGYVGRKSGRRKKPQPWGHVELGGRELVWIGDGAEVAGVYVDHLDPSDIVEAEDVDESAPLVPDASPDDPAAADGRSTLKLLFDIGIPAVLVLSVMLTLLCLRFFVRYAKERDDFMAATAHDLITPLVALRRLVRNDDGDIRNLSERMIRLVKNLTDFLAHGGRRARPECKPFDLRKAYDDAYGLFREDFRWLLDGRDVETVGPDTLPVVADETMTVQILWNLLANELKYAAPFGKVSVRFEAEADVVRVVFTDEGKGLSHRDRRRIFRRYYRAKSIMNCGKGGFGIGLCTSRDFARAMGGELSVADNPPHGCIFTLTIRRTA